MKFFGIFMGVLVLVILFMSSVGKIIYLYDVPPNSFLTMILTWIITRDVYDYLEKKNSKE
ncbi:MAG: hypothetical protein GX778_06775 [Erysipelothrix sp.]|nr:hypothetical protein [Erysipelothrix sp.]